MNGEEGNLIFLLTYLGQQNIQKYDHLIKCDARRAESFLPGPVLRGRCAHVGFVCAIKSILDFYIYFHLDLV